MNPELPAFAVGDHVKTDRAEEGNTQQNTEVLGFAEKNVAAEAGELFNLTLTTTPLGSNDLNRGVHGLNGIETPINLLEKLVERRTHDHLGRAGLGDGADVGQAAGKRGSKRNRSYR
jgi:hypothetical protein